MRTLLILSFIFTGYFLDAQQLILVRDSIMQNYMSSGQANQLFRPNGDYKKGKRTGFWKDYEVKKDGSYQEVEGSPLKTLGMYLFYGEGKFENDNRVGDWAIFVIENNTLKKFLSQKLSYKDGTPEGTFQYFYPTGQLAQTGEYKNGKIEGSSIIYYKNGQTFGIQNFVADKKQGIQKYYYSSGKPSFTIEYKDGKQDGTYRSWYENGALKETFIYLENEIDGTYRYYYPSGKLWTEKIYTNGKLMNVVATYDKEGKELDKGTLKDGNGYVNYFDENGKIYSVTTYKDGKKVSEESR